MAELKIRLDCPHCGVRERRPICIIRYLKVTAPNDVAVTTQVIGASRLLASAFCDDCKSPFCIVVTPGANSSIHGILESAGNEIGTEAAMKGAKIRLIPNTGTFEANDGLPEAIRQPFADIQEDAMKRRNAPGVMATARACLDVALKALGETQGGRVQRIQNLQNKGVLTSSLSEWANKLWADGNDAVHDLEAKMDDAIEHVEFLKLFFEVVFVLPNKIAHASNAAATTQP